MGVEWFRDLSITILALVTAAVLIFASILVYRLYRTLSSTMLLVNTAGKLALDTFTLVQGGPLAVILALIRGLRGGLSGISQNYIKESIKRGKRNE